MTKQEKFNKMYNEGIENNDLSLTQSDIKPIELIESGIMKMFEEGEINDFDILKLLIESYSSIANDYKDF